MTAKSRTHPSWPRSWKNSLRKCLAVSPIPAPLCLAVSLQVRVGLQCMFQRKTCLCLHSRSIRKPHGAGVHLHIFAFLWHIFYDEVLSGGCNDRGKFHWVECRLCTARLTHRCFPDSCPAFLCHCALSFHTFESTVVAACGSSPVPSAAAVPPGTNARLWLLLFFRRGRTGDYRRPA